MADVFVPLNTFKSVLTQLSGVEEDVIYTTPNGVSTILLSGQFTNKGNQTENINIRLDSNRQIPEPQTDSITSPGGYVTASLLIQENQTFIEKEATAYVEFLNNQEDIPFDFTASIFEGYVRTAVDGVQRDLQSGSALRTERAALSYYDKNGEILIPNEYYTSSYTAIEYAGYLIQEILNNTSVTASSEVSQLYQNNVTQSILPSLTAESGSITLTDELITVIVQTIEDPVRVEQQPLELVNDIEILPNDSFSPVVAGKLVLEEGFSLLVSGSSNMTVILSILESANE